jgi:hypothetical protein
MGQEREGRPGTVLHLLRPDEEFHAEMYAVEGILGSTDRRLVLGDGTRVLLDIPYEGLRRVQLDVERGRTATLVIVPEYPHSPPQVLSIPESECASAAEALRIIGERLGGG